MSRTPTPIEKERDDDDDAIDAAASPPPTRRRALENARDATTASHRSTFNAHRNE